MYTTYDIVDCVLEKDLAFFGISHSPWSVNPARSEDGSTHHTLRCNGFNEGMSSGCHTQTQKHTLVHQHTDGTVSCSLCGVVIEVS